jgi:hypothetical protein
MPVELTRTPDRQGSDPWPEGHYVQLHGPDGRTLARDVGRFIEDGLASGNTTVVVATAEHRAAFVAELGGNVTAAISRGTLVFFDANDTLERFMAGGYPDPSRFDAILGEFVREAAARGNGLRVYGEMVGVLWQSGQYPAAIRLEQLWNRLRRDVSFTLYCGYPIDVFGNGFEPGMVEALLCAHTHLLPAAAGTSLEWAVSRAIDDVLGLRPENVKPHLGGHEKRENLPAGESMILWLRANHPDRADEVLTHARSYFELSA